MSQFIQFHILTSYPPGNLNRDDLGAPKTAMLGGKRRLRISSQCLKRTWRTSEVFQERFAGQLGQRTKRMGTELFEQLCQQGVSEGNAKEWATKMAEAFGKLKAEDKKEKTPDKDAKKKRAVIEHETMTHYSPEEQQALQKLVHTLVSTGRAPTADELKLLTRSRTGVDIALFGRMLAATPEFNCDAAAQVAHAITVHETAVESDYFSAVDDLNRGDEDRGSGHIGEQEFGAGVFYLYLCINHTQLLKNLGGHQALADRAAKALLEAALTVAPSGKQNSFGTRAYASYLRIEKGSRQPRALTAAFLMPTRAGEKGMMANAINALETTCTQLDQCYGPVAEAAYTMNTLEKVGTLRDALAFVEGGQA
ncbi:MAG: type I-E CRISPR-associated protein Cas7/Cse4/CasC [Myxococcota bacterium]